MSSDSKRSTSTDYSRPHRPAAVRLYNRIGASAARPLELDSLLAEAQRRVGASHFGDPSFREPLCVLLAAIESEAHLHPLGRAIMRTRLVSLLENRLRLEQFHSRYPESADIAIRRPIVIAGLQRTGTTNLHRLLSADPRLRALSSYEVLDPVPPSELGQKLLRRDPRLLQAKLAEAIVKTRIPGLSLVPATVDLSGAELELADFPRRNFILKDALEEYSVHGENAYSYILIDCPPSLTLLTLNAMAAADSVMVPLQCEFFALEGLSQLLRTVERVRRSFNPLLQMHGIVLTMFDRRNRLTEQVADDVRACLGNAVFDTVIPRNVRLSEAPSHGLPALIYDHRCAGSEAYMGLAREVVGRLPALKVAA